MKNIFIDSDCGIDDAIAIMIALASKNVNVRGISAVAGNAGLDHVVNNITGLLAYFGRTDIPVYRGASTSFPGMRIHAEGVHGSNGLGDVDLPENSKDLEPIMAYAVDKTIVFRKIKENLKMELSFNTMKGASVPCEGLKMDIIPEIKKDKFNSILNTIKTLE